MDAAQTEMTALADNPADKAEHAHATRRGDTRVRIQQVALELFAEQGYERTSLREIAERLGVTKAALYYHFKSKEDIVRSFTEDYFCRIDALIAWGREQRPGPRTAQELLDRYITIVMESGEVFSSGSLSATRRRSTGRRTASTASRSSGPGWRRSWRSSPGLTRHRAPGSGRPPRSSPSARHACSS
jgi:AcrR family transcriptional regulator